MEVFGRDLAPISGEALAKIDAQATASLTVNLSARRFVDVKGPYGWDYSAVPTGRFEKMQKDGAVAYGLRVSAPIIESRVEFELGLLELQNIDRGAADTDLAPVERASIAMASFEDKVVYRGLEKTGIPGMKSSSWYPPLELPKADPEAFVHALIVATHAMKTGQSVGGPYALVGGHALRDALGRLISGRTLLDVLRGGTEIADYVFTPSFDEAFLVSTRGGDFEFTLGGDFTVGFDRREGDVLKFYLAESFAFRILESRAYRIIDLK
ncbi:MAG: bacteriocin family protein [Synergistaceae bacterium]|jgi:uncharacterized linocin/CFP29 family protein|nr:bacteriocin family protein [Synergistaceae bacterium]